MIWDIIFGAILICCGLFLLWQRYRFPYKETTFLLAWGNFRELLFGILLVITGIAVIIWKIEVWVC